MAGSRDSSVGSLAPVTLLALLALIQNAYLFRGLDVTIAPAIATTW